MKKIMSNILIGLAIGFTSNAILLFLYKGTQTGPQMFSVWLMSALIGLIANIFLIPKLSIFIKTVIQFIASFALVFVTGLYNHWFQFELPSFILFVGIFLIIFFIIWIGIYLYEKNELKKMNRKF